MARSSYIYMVMESTSFNVRPVAGFTVKHEMVGWLKLQDHLEFLHIYRMPDNPTGYYAEVGKNGPRVVDITLEILSSIGEVLNVFSVSICGQSR